MRNCTDSRVSGRGEGVGGGGALQECRHADEQAPHQRMHRAAAIVYIAIVIAAMSCQKAHILAIYGMRVFGKLA
jgi:hypothetical protein